MKLLVLGPMPPPIGGVTVSMQYLVDALRSRDDVGVKLINVSEYKATGLRRITRLIALVRRVVKDGREADVLCLHIGVNALPWFGPVAVGLAWMMNKPLLIRLFGGVLIQELPWLRSRLAHWAAGRCDLFLVQTKMALAACKNERAVRAEWFPTVRPKSSAPIQPQRPSSHPVRFIFLGQMKGQKGLGEIKEALKLLPHGTALVDCYGPMQFDLNEAFFDEQLGFHYKGVLAPEQVLTTVAQYSALLLPTYYVGEGYPGVILEAYNAGVPVVASEWRAVPELVNENCGTVVAPKDPAALAQAMKLFVDDPNYADRFQEGVAQMRQQFDFDAWIEKYVQYCRAALDARTEP